MRIRDIGRKLTQKAMCPPMRKAAVDDSLGDGEQKLLGACNDRTPRNEVIAVPTRSCSVPTEGWRMNSSLQLEHSARSRTFTAVSPEGCASKICQRLASKISSNFFVLSRLFSPRFADDLRRLRIILFMAGKRFPQFSRRPNACGGTENTKKNYRIFCMYGCKSPNPFSHTSFAA